MRTVLKQIGLLLLLFALIGAAAAWKHFQPAPPEETLEQEESLKRYGFYLTDYSKQCKIDFVHKAPQNLDSQLSHILPLINAMGASVSVVDFNKDGLPDLYVVTSVEGGKNRLYQNMGDGTFKDVAAEMGVADLNQPGTGVCMGAIWGDYDNDGYEDLLVYKWGKPELFHNDKGKGFTRVTEGSGLPAWMNANSAVWVDFDRDGHLDLFIAGYWPEDVDLWHLKTTKIMPNDFQYSENGGRKHLLRNKGDGTFEDVTNKMGITSTRWTLAVGAADLTGSGYPDLFVANDYGVSELYANRGGKKFEEIGATTEIAKTAKSGMNVCFGDVYNRGQLAVYVSNISDPGNLLQGNNLWVPDAHKQGGDPRFKNLANSMGVEMGGWSWGAQFGDLNNDGLLDLYLTNGYISANRNQDYWYDYSKIATAYKGILVDAKNWPEIKDRSLAGYQTKCLWLGKGGKFVDVCRAVGVKDTYDGRSVAMVDLWNRGVLDVVVANQDGPLLIYKNTVTPENKWIQFDLEGSKNNRVSCSSLAVAGIWIEAALPGTKSNRSAIGAQVRLFWDGKEQVQEVSGGGGYAAQNMRPLHFGLGRDPHIEKVVIRWPSGTTQTLTTNLETNQRHPVKEPE